MAFVTPVQLFEADEKEKLYFKILRFVFASSSGRAAYVVERRK